MKAPILSVEEFVFRGLLAEEALDKAGRKNKIYEGFYDEEIAETLSIQLLNEELVLEAKKMAAVYTAIASFENSVRELVQGVLLESNDENWWQNCVSEKIRNRAETKKKDEMKNRWHSQRGADPIFYTLLGDLKSIIRQNWNPFEPYFPNIEWVDNIFDTVERSRNVIMHSSTLDRADIERLGIFIRAWIKQVGT